MQFSDNFLHIAVHNFFQQYMYTIFIPQSRMTQPIVSINVFQYIFQGGAMTSLICIYVPVIHIDNCVA